MESGGFCYCDEYHAHPGEYVARIPGGLVATQELLATLANKLSLPPYFGFNWNALADCLRDLGWIKESRVALVHSDLPRIPEDDCRQYVDVLSEAIGSWKPGEEHSQN